MADNEDELTSDRSLTLTDGVVAIALTLLALDLKPDIPPTASSGDLANYFGHHAGQYYAFVIAFVLIAQFWTIHHRLMHGVRRTSPALLTATLVWLFWITLMPLTTYLQGYFSNALGGCLFAVNIALISAALAVIATILQRAGLSPRHESAEQRRQGLARSVTVVIISLAVAGLVWVVGSWIDFLFLAAFFADAPGQMLARRTRR